MIEGSAMIDILPPSPARKLVTRAHRMLRVVSKFAWALLDRHHPVLVHLIPMRRCNLACRYCNEYDAVSAPVPLDVMLRRVDRLAELGTSTITISGGEPLMHPDLDAIVARVRMHGMVVTMITNGYHLSPERIARLNRAGLDHLEISIDNVEPDEISMKSLRLLEPKLQWLAQYAQFSVAINSVVGSGIRNPEDALQVTRRARELGFISHVGVIHDGRGQLKAMAPREMAVYRELRGRRKGVVRLASIFQDNLAEGRPNEWSCRAGARYLYVDENGIVNYCSQQRGRPGIPLESYGRADIEREYATPKACAPYCTINCVQWVGILDNWRSPQVPLAAAAARPRPGAVQAVPAAKPPADRALVG
jgi:MoaA/NifB/PqqE/SkfB family radical SAM enzyme